MATTQFMISELQREPRRVLSHIDDGDIILKRRDGSTLLLTVKTRDDSRDEAYVAMVKMMRTVLVHSSGVAGDVLPAAFPWVEFLTAGDRAVFATELSRMLDATAELDTTAPLVQLLAEWKATAEVRADPSLADRLSEPVDRPVDEPALAPR